MGNDFGVVDPGRLFAHANGAGLHKWSGLLQALFFDKVQVITKGLSMPFSGAFPPEKTA